MATHSQHVSVEACRATATATVGCSLASSGDAARGAPSDGDPSVADSDGPRVDGGSTRESSAGEPPADVILGNTITGYLPFWSNYFISAKL